MVGRSRINPLFGRVQTAHQAPVGCALCHHENIQMTTNIKKKLPALEDDPAWREPVDWGFETDASKVDEYLYK